MDDERDSRGVRGREVLRAAMPPAAFDRDAIRGRIEASLESETGKSDRRPGDRLRDPTRRARRIGLRAAAAVALFAGGALAGGWTAPSPGALPVDDARLELAGGPPGVLEPAEVPLSIQTTGTGYVASLALLSEMGTRLSPEQREQARQVALAVLSGAVAELLAAEDGDIAEQLLASILSHGFPLGEDGFPVVRSR